MNVIILCAGYATRLYPLTEKQPKPLLTVADKPIIEYLLTDIATIDDVDKVYVITNDKFASHFEKWNSTFDYLYPIEVINDNTKSNDDRLGAIGDIKFTIQEKDIADDILIVAGDNIFDLDLKDFISFARGKKPYTTIAAFDIKDRELAKRYGLVELNDEHQVMDFKEKPAEPQTTLASLGLYYYSERTITLLSKYIAEGNNTDQPGNFIAWLAKNDPVFSYTFDGSWFDIGDFKSLEKANEFYSNNM